MNCPLCHQHIPTSKVLYKRCCPHCQTKIFMSSDSSYISCYIVEREHNQCSISIHPTTGLMSVRVITGNIACDQTFIFWLTPSQIEQLTPEQLWRKVEVYRCFS